MKSSADSKLRRLYWTAPPLLYYYYIAMVRQFKSLGQRFSEGI